jgi:hypothetical protein
VCTICNETESLPDILCCGALLLFVCSQVLPVNDTCVYNMWWDSYPYSSVSVHALHPQYVALRAMLDDLPGQDMPADIAAEIEAARVSDALLYSRAADMRCHTSHMSRVAETLSTGFFVWYSVYRREAACCVMCQAVLVLTRKCRQQRQRLRQLG